VGRALRGTPPSPEIILTGSSAGFSSFQIERFLVRQVLRPGLTAVLAWCFIGTMGQPTTIPAAIVRGGTSKGVFLRADDLPDDPAVRDRIILAVFGSPDPRQIDGLGGADPLTSKVAIIGKSARSDADVDYTHGYVGVETGIVDYEGNCGNISQAVGPYAVDEGLVPVSEPVTSVRIFNTNTHKLMVAEVPVLAGRAVSEGDCSIHGVPGTGARILVSFIDAVGSKTGRLLPTGNLTDVIHLGDGGTVEASLVDVAAPAVFIRAADLGMTGFELPSELTRRPDILKRMQAVRAEAAVMMGLAPDRSRVSPAIPKIGVVASPSEFRTISGEAVAASACDLVARTLALGALHKAYSVTGGLCLSAAASIEGTVVNQARSRAADAGGTVRIGHPSGVSDYVVQVVRDAQGAYSLRRAAVAGTARRIMDGRVYLPAL
jgi:methylitaconate Delta-isomerase